MIGKSLAAFLAACLMPLLLAGQEVTRFEFTKPNGKPRSLKAGREVVLHLMDSLDSSYEPKRWHTVTGSLQRVTLDSITVDLAEEERYGSIRDDGYSFKSWGTRTTDRDTVISLRAFPVRAVDHLTYTPNTQVGTAITVFSAIGLLIYAPLRGMRFRDGTFDGDRYLRAATPCAIGLGVGLVFIPITDSKRKLHLKVGG